MLIVFPSESFFAYLCSHICYCKLTSFSSSIAASSDHDWTPFYWIPISDGRISLPGECIVLNVGVFLETCSGGERYERSCFHSENSPPRRRI